MVDSRIDPLVVTEKWIRERLNLTIDTLGEYDIISVDSV